MCSVCDPVGLPLGGAVVRVCAAVCGECVVVCKMCARVLTFTSHGNRVRE